MSVMKYSVSWKKRHTKAPDALLDKTKSPEALRDWLGEKEGLLSWKMDAVLTVVLTCRDGVLQKAVTRGNLGAAGEVITNNARVFKNLPGDRIPFAGEVVLRGEAVIKYSDFKKINEGIEDVARPAIRTLVTYAAVLSRQLNNEATCKEKCLFLCICPCPKQKEENWRILWKAICSGYRILDLRLYHIRG